jgi:hypothetical protein
MITKTVFFTRNGIHLGTAFKDIKIPLIANANGTSRAIYPSVGMRTPGEAIQTNFGHQVFRFAIEAYVADERRKIWSTIKSVPSTHHLDAAVHELVVGYLVHHGYQRTARALLGSRKSRTGKSDVQAGEIAGTDVAVIKDMEQRARTSPLLQFFFKMLIWAVGRM